MESTKNTNETFNDKFSRRTKFMALKTIKLIEPLPNKPTYWVIGKQLIRSSTSVASNFRAVRQARSQKERFAKLCIVVEEADETLFWLEFLETGQLIDNTTEFIELKQEVLEIVKVMSSYKSKLKNRS